MPGITRCQCGNLLLLVFLAVIAAGVIGVIACALFFTVSTIYGFAGTGMKPDMTTNMAPINVTMAYDFMNNPFIPAHDYRCAGMKKGCKNPYGGLKMTDAFLLFHQPIKKITNECTDH